MGTISKKKSTTYDEYRVYDENTYELSRKHLATKKMNAGAYKAWRDMWGGLYVESTDLITDELIEVEGSPSAKVLDNIRDFLSDKTRSKYKKNNFLYKRGILLYGPPGGGKTTSVAKVVRDSLEKDYLVLLDTRPGDLKQIMDAIRDIEPNRFIVVVWEDLDELLSYDEKAILGLLDGRTQIENVLYIATTNYIDKIPARIKDRPSRFALVTEIGLPTDEERKIFISKKLPDDEKWQTTKLVEVSEGLSYDQLKELILNVCIYCTDQEEAVRKLKFK